MQTNNKICLVLPSLKIGGMERVMVNLANHLTTKFNCEIHLILLGPNQGVFELDKKIKVYTPNFRYKNKLAYTFMLIIYLRKLILKIKPLSVLSFGEMYNNFSILATLNLNTQLFVSDRSKPDKDWGLFQNHLRKKLYKKTTGIICQTTYAHDFIKRIINHNNITIIPNPSLFSHSFQIKRKEEKILLNVGRLIQTKNIDVLIRIFKNLNRPDWQLWIVGDGRVLFCSLNFQ